jgi:mono/diheme cytochrome c family protein
MVACTLVTTSLALVPASAAPPRAAWTADERKQFYHLPEGSEIFPLDWLVALKSNQTGKLFVEDLGRFGFIEDGKGDEIRGSEGKRFPIGLTVSKPRGLTLELIGVNCAACHVGQITHGDKSLVIDGAPNMLDIESFYQEIFQSFDATLRDRKELIAFLKRLKSNGPRDGPTRVLVALLPWLEKGAPQGGLESVVFQRLQRLVSGTTALAGQEDYLKLASSAGGKDARDLAARLFARQAERIKREGEGLKTLGDALTGGGKGLQGELGKALADLGVERLALLEARVAFLKRLKDLHAPGRPQFRPGPGRVDAFVTARNLLFKPADILPADSPVSYPHLWGLSTFGWLHWDGNTNSIMERNVGQSLGLGAVAVPGTGQSTVLPKNLHTLEGLAKKIPAPEWPVATLGARPIADLAAAGKKLYGQYCASCHDRQEGAVMVSGSPVYPADKIGTDPRRARNFATPLSDKTAFADGLAAILHRIKERAYKDAGLTPQESAAMDLPQGKIKWLTTKGYVARPLAGAWATAPYLHNGSVPTLDDLLKPAADRPRVFPLGHREYDLDRLGYVSDPAAVPKDQLGRVFYFDVRQPGNSNAGHDKYRDKPFDEKERKALLEYLKTLK